MTPCQGDTGSRAGGVPLLTEPKIFTPASPVLQARDDISLDGFAHSLVLSTRMRACRVCAGPVLGVRARLLQPGRGGEWMGGGAREKREGVREGWRRGMGGRQERV